MAKLAFLGLGAMGTPMATRLVEAGHDVTVWNRTAEKAEPLVERGARRAASPAEAAAAVDGVFTMLRDAPVVEDVLLGADGAVAAMEPGSTVVEMSTIGPDAVRSIASRLPSHVDMLDAPVLGSIREATEAALKVFVGGPEETCARWLPVLEAFGSVRRLGDLGAGAAMKVVANATLMVLMTGLGEALALGDALGLEQGAVLDVLSDSAIGVTARGKRSRIETGTFPPNFTVSLARKDAELIVDAAAKAGIELRVTEASRAWLAEAEDAGLGASDYSAVLVRILDRSKTPATQEESSDR